MLSHIIRLLVLPLLAALLSSGQALADDGLAQTIRDRYASLKTFQAKFTQYLTQKDAGKREERKGELLFRKPLLISWETKSPAPELLVVTEAEIWDYVADEKIAYRYPRELVDDSRSLVQIVTGQALLSQDFDVQDAGSEGALRVLDLYPKDPTPQLVQARIYVDPVKGYIQRAVIFDFYGNENDVRFTSFTPNADIPARAFRFSPPSGVEVEDRVEKPVESRDLF